MSEPSTQRTQIRPPSPGTSPTGDSRTVSLSPTSGSSLVRRVGGASHGSVDDQPTVISRNPLAAHSAISLATFNPAELGRILEGERLGHFDLQEFVGGGGMGAVFRALDTMLNRIVAVKVLSQDQASDEEALKRFKNEAQSAARLDHENISRVYYVGEDRGLHYIVFEYIEGINLRDLVLQNGPLAIEDAISYTLQIADALDHASDRDVVHRDIKPSNILITPDGKAKVVDMGLARLHQIAQPDNDLTASGVTLGTFDYISPEQARDPRAADVRSDLYSLGCTVYFLLTGRPPFPEGTVLQKLLQHQGDEPADPRTLREDLPDDLVAIVRKLMAKSPSARYQTPADLAAALLELSADLGVSPQGGESGVRAALAASRRSAWQRHLPWAVPGAALLMVIALLNWFTPGTDDPLPPAPGTLPSNVKVNVDQRGGTATAQVNKSSTSTTTSTTDKNNSTTPSNDKREGSTFVGTASIKNIPDLSSGATRPDNLNLVLSPSATGETPLSPGRHTLTDPGSLSRSPGIVAPVEPPMPAPRKGVLIVAGPDNDPDTFTTLRAAVAAAKNNDVIELRFNGRLEEKPLAINNLKLTIRAAEGFQPILAFRPTGDLNGIPRSMITVTGGQLSLINLPVELDLLPEAVLESWSLCELQHADSLRLENCWLTIRNASTTGGSFHRDVAFLDITSAQGADSMMLNPGAPPIPAVTVDLKNCVVRGEATFVRSNELQPVHLQWENGWFAGSERFWTSDGGEHSARGQANIQIELRHMTSITRGGFCQFWNSSDAPHQLDVDIHCEDSILVGGEGALLLEQYGIDRVQEFQQRISWMGNRNFYEDFASFWRVRGSDSENIPLLWTAREWFDHWGLDHENSVQGSRVGWLQLPEANRAAHSLVPADFQLNTAEDNPARRAAGDGRNVGMTLDQLPAPPPVRDSTPSSKGD